MNQIKALSRQIAVLMENNNNLLMEFEDIFDYHSQELLIRCESLKFQIDKIETSMIKQIDRIEEKVTNQESVNIQVVCKTINLNITNIEPFKTIELYKNIQSVLL